MARHLSLAGALALLMPASGSAKTVTSITKASPAACTSTAHGYATGDYVFLDQPSVDTGAGPALYKATVSDANTFTVPYDNSGGTGGAQTAKAVKVTAGLIAKLYPNDVDAINDALKRLNAKRGSDASYAAVESTLDSLFVSGGNNP